MEEEGNWDGVKNKNKKEMTKKGKYKKRGRKKIKLEDTRERNKDKT